VVRLWISNEKYATTVLIELSKSCVFSGKEGLSPAGNEDGLLTYSHQELGKWEKLRFLSYVWLHRGLYAEKR